jgi:hypothetical protein
MSYGSKRWLPSSHHLGYMEASRKTKIPLEPKQRYTPTKGTLAICLCSTIGRMPSDRTSRSLDASLVIPTRVLRLEAFGSLRPKPVGPVLQIGQVGFGLRATPGLRPQICGSAE